MVGCDEPPLHTRRWRSVPWRLLARTVASAALLGPGIGHGEEPAIIPIPAAVITGEGAFAVGDELHIIVPPGDRMAGESARELVDLLSGTIGLRLSVRRGAGSDHAVILKRASAPLPPEGYRLTVTARRITIEAMSSAGWFYGGVTLWQLLTPTA